MKLAGFDLFEVSSGKHKGKHRIPKRGRALIRQLLFFAAINAIKSHGIMPAGYQKMLNSKHLKQTTGSPIKGWARHC
ncbi:transposase [Thermodesulfobacteriota bacterium]